MNKSQLDPIIDSAEAKRERKGRERFVLPASVKAAVTEQALKYFLFRQEYKIAADYGIKNINGRDVTCFYKSGRNGHYIITTDTGEGALIQFERAEEIAGRILDAKTVGEKKFRKFANYLSVYFKGLAGDPLNLRYFVIVVCFAESDVRAKEVFDRYMRYGNINYIYPVIYDKKNGRFIFNASHYRSKYCGYKKIRKVILNNIIGKETVIKGGTEDYKPIF